MPSVCYRLFIERRAASETSTEFVLLSFYSQCINPLNIIARCNQLNVNTVQSCEKFINLWGDLTYIHVVESKFLIEGN